MVEMSDGARLDRRESGCMSAVQARPEKKRTARERFGSKPNPFEHGAGYAVVRGADHKRVSMLPRRTEWQDYSAALELVLAKPPVAPGSCAAACPCLGTGVMRLRPLQAWALSEFLAMRGGLGILGVGTGKTLCSLLLPRLMGWERGLLLVPAALRDKTLKIDVPLLSRHWHLPSFSDTEGLSYEYGGPRVLDVGDPATVVVCSYEELSRESKAEYLEKTRVPDGIFADEVHFLKRRGSGRTKRVLRYFQKQPGCEFVGASGTVTHRSVMDYGHLLNLGLDDASPVPHSFLELKTWADALDEDVQEYARAKPGALFDFCREGETARDGYRRRLLESPGVVSSSDFSTSIGLTVRETPMPEAPPAVVEAFTRLRNKAEMPDGEKCSSALGQARHARELTLGFFLRWVWPEGKRDQEWLDARKIWRSYVRKVTQKSHNGRWYDTEMQVANAVRRGELDALVVDERTGQWVNAHDTWFPVRADRRARWGQDEPPREIVWLSDYMVEHLEQWASKNLGIVWVENVLFMEHLRKRGNTCFGAGENEVELEDGKRSVFCSYAHATGKNLQIWDRMYFPNPLTSGKAWEQGLGREHRPNCRKWAGKQYEFSDEVVADVSIGCREAWWSFTRSKLDARYTEETLGQPQRLNRATLVDMTTEETVLARCDAGDPLWAETGHARIDDLFSAGGRAREEDRKREEEQGSEEISPG
jgi:hypothetical protein